MADNASETARIFIDGEAGTTGLGIRDRLAAIPGIELRSLTGNSRKDPVARRAIMEEVDLVVLCLPDAAAMESTELADSLGRSAPKLLDASTAHRVAPGWVYGFRGAGAGAGRPYRPRPQGLQPRLLSHRRRRIAAPAGG